MRNQSITMSTYRISLSAFLVFLFSCLLSVTLVSAQNGRSGDTSLSNVWVADNGDGTYKNPVLHADYSDPDVVRAGDDFYMTASSFNCVPGLPILHSKDLVNWQLVNHALKKLDYAEGFDQPRHGNGVWAPCIRYHNDEFYIYFPDPDHGIYMIKTKDPRGRWSEPVLVKGGKGLIDPTPLWDDDGKAYLAHAFAGSRAGIKSLIVVSEMYPDGTKVVGDEVMVLDGHDDQPTVEGPKLYKRAGYYYIFAPAGGVPTGWQLILRAKNIFGPYEKMIVLEQGSTPVNGPHQGAWVDTPGGEHWFIHFQDKGAYGRIVHLQPVKWVNDWPVMGVDKDGDGKGEPVLTCKKPDVGKTFPKQTPPESDEFNSPVLGLQWQWHANPEVYWGFPTASGYYRMYCRPTSDTFINFWDVPNLLLQKFPAPEFTATARMTFNARTDDERTGLIVMGRDYAYLAVKNKGGKLFVSQTICKNADKKGTETEGQSAPIGATTFYLRVKVSADGVCEFSYSEDGKTFKPAGVPFKSREGGWIGAKMGFFALRNGITNDSGSVDIDWFRVENN